MELTIEQSLQQGVAAHKEGKLQEAERLYRAILQAQPAHPDANHNLGVIAVSVNKADAALLLFKTALEANAKIEQFWLSYIDALIKEQQFENAKEVLIRAFSEYTAIMQLVRLCSEKGFDPETAPKGLIDRLCAAANVPTLETLQAQLVETERQVAEIFRTFLGDPHSEP